MKLPTKLKSSVEEGKETREENREDSTNEERPKNGERKQKSIAVPEVNEHKNI